MSSDLNTKMHLLCPLQKSDGFTFFYVFFLIPVILSLCMVVVDLSVWFSLQESAQRAADTIAFSAARMLPDTEAAENYISSAVMEMEGFQLNQNDTTVLPHSVTVSLYGVHQPIFDVFVKLFTGDEVGLRIARSGSVQVAPSDTVIILSDGYSLRPGINQDGSVQDPWSNTSEWPPSRFFECTSAPSFPTSEPITKHWSWNEEMWANHNLRRWISQSCFNPAFSALKHGAISLVDFIGTFPNNKLSLLFSPGNTGTTNYSTLRNIQAPVSTLSGNTYTTPGGYVAHTAEGPQAQWLATQYFHQMTAFGDEACVIFSNPQATLGDHSYSLYETPSILGLPTSESHYSNPLAETWPGCGAPYQPGRYINTQYMESHITLREAIYWHAAKLPDPEVGFTAIPDITSSISQALVQLTLLQSTEPDETARNMRGNLFASPLKNIIVITDNLPPAGELVPLISSIVDNNVRLSLVVFAHPFLSDDNLSTLKANAHDLNRIFSDLGQKTNDNIHLKLFTATDPDTLVRKVIPQLLPIHTAFAIKN